MTEVKVKRSQVRTYLDVDPGYEDWELIGEGARSSVVNMNPDVSEEHYIHEDSGTKNVESYSPDQDVDFVAINGEAIFEYIDSLMKNRSILGDAETQIVNVWAYEEEAVDGYPAELQDVTISIESKGGEGGQNVEIPFTIHYRGDPTQGYFDVDTLTFTAAS
jgi:hypothetical protein